MGDIFTSASPRFVGKSVKRKENKRFLTGRGLFVDDMVIPGMLHAAILRSPVARARMVSIDTSAALELPGVLEVFTAADINHLFGPLLNSGDETMPFGVDVVLAAELVSFVGEPIAIVLAENRYVAEDALELIDVDYDLLDPVIEIEDARTAPPCLPGKDSNLVHSMDMPLPGAEEAFAAAATVVATRIRQPRVAPTPMEARGIICDPRMPDRLDIHMTSQNPHEARAYFSKMLGIPENHVRIMAPDVGGGFGQKYSMGRDYLATIAASRLCGRPVKWIEDRAEALVAGGFGRKEHLGLAIAFDAGAIMRATRFDWEDNCGAEQASSQGVATLASLMHTNAYNIPTTSIKTRGWYTNIGPTIAYRGPWAGETLIREVLIEKAARELGIDCIELRKRNLIRQWPHMLPLQVSMDGITAEECLDLLVEKVGYEEFRKEQAEARKQGRYLGIGISLCIEPTAISPLNFVESVVVRMDGSGKYIASVSCTSQGHSIETTFAQVVADEMSCDVEDVTISYGDTSNGAGFGMSAGGSGQAVKGGGALVIASGKLRSKLLGIAAHLLQTTADQLELRAGQVVSKSGGASISLAEIARTSNTESQNLPLGTDPGLSADASYANGGMTFANAAHACIVEVDIETGIVKVLRYVVAEDCGVLLNPAVVEGQVSGGIAQGIGNILWETQTFDENGTPGATTFKDYAMPLANDIPVIEFHHICTPSDTPTGAKGVGEGGAIVGAPACYNAVMDALAPFAAEIEQLPLSPSRILAAVAKGRSKN
jgi:carbon-monoxide dehydrogenase large subunit